MFYKFFLFLLAEPAFEKCHVEKKDSDQVTDSNPFDDSSSSDKSTETVKDSKPVITNKSGRDDDRLHAAAKHKSCTLPASGFKNTSELNPKSLTLKLSKSSSPSKRPMYEGTPPSTPEDEKGEPMRAITPPPDLQNDSVSTLDRYIKKTFDKFS